MSWSGLAETLFTQGESETEFNNFAFTSDVTHSHNIKINRALVFYLDNAKLADSTYYCEGSLVSLSSATTYKL